MVGNTAREYGFLVVIGIVLFVAAMIFDQYGLNQIAIFKAINCTAGILILIFCLVVARKWLFPTKEELVEEQGRLRDEILWWEEKKREFSGGREVENGLKEAKIQLAAVNRRLGVK